MTTLAAPASTSEHDYGVDYPVRVEVPMPRDLFDRLTAPRRRTDLPLRRGDRSGRVRRDARACRTKDGQPWLIGSSSTLELMMMETGLSLRILPGRSTRLVSDDGAFEADTSLFVNPTNAVIALEIEGYLDTRQGHPVPDLVVEVDRSVNSKGKLLPYFRMGVREAWTWSPHDGARIWIPDSAASDGMRIAEDSTVLPGISLEALDRLLAEGFRDERFELSRHLAQRVAAAWSR